MSKLRADEFVNSDDNGAPSFPQGATVPAPTADNHFATKLYTDTSASTKSSSITNTISNTAPSNPSAGDFWTNTSQNIIALNIWNGSSWVNVKNSIEISAGQIVTPPSISDPNGGYIPTMLTATSAVVSDATLSSSKWYKDDVEIPGATGLQFYATEIGTYKYEEIWVDTFGTQLFPSLSAVIDARAGVIDAQPTITSSNGVYSPTTLTATAAVVSNATLVGSKWYKDGVEVPGETGLSINILAHEGGIYKYEETWTDHFGTQLLPTLSASVQVFVTIADPTVLTPIGDTGFPDFDYTTLSSAIANVNNVFEPGTSAFSTTLFDVVDPTGGTGWPVPMNVSTGIDNTDKSLIWFKRRNANYNHFLYDTVRGTSHHLISNSGSGQSTGGRLLSYSSDGFSFAASGEGGQPYVAWNFKAAPGFFDVVQYAGNSTGSSTGPIQEVPHSLGSAPGCMMIKNLDTSEWWIVYHKDLAASECLYLNQSNSKETSAQYAFNNTRPTSTHFTVGQLSNVNMSGNNFIAYLFADNPSNGIKCGSYTSTTQPLTVSVGFEPGWLMIKRTNNINGMSSSAEWIIVDNQRGNGKVLKPNESGVELNTTYPVLTSDGFEIDNHNFAMGEIGGEYVYIAIGDPITPDNSETQLTLTDTTVSKVSDGSLVDGVSIDQALTVGESVKASGIESYWLTMISHSNNDTRVSPNGIAFDNAGGIYVAGQETSVDNAAYVAKFNDGGNISWQTSLNYYGANEAANDVAIDSLNNLYYCGYSQMAGNKGGIIVKYNNSGTLQWQRLLSTTTGGFAGLDAVEVDSSDNVIVVGSANMGSSGSETSGVLIAKYNSSGVLQWARTLDQQGSGWSPNKNEYGYGIAVDSSDNIYVCGEAGNSSYGRTDCLIAKYNSSGNIQWQKLLGDQYSTTEDRFRGITVDSSDNIYVVGHSEKPTDNDDTIVAKYDTSGNLVWQKYIQNDAKGRSIDTDSSGNVYILSEQLRDVGEGGSDAYIAKLDNSGNIQWQNALGGAYNEDCFCLRLDPSDNLYISGTTRSPSANTDTTGLLFKIPTDGSLVGTYGGLTYQSVSLNSAASSLQDRTSNFTDSANSQINDSASTLPDEFDPGYTADITTISGVSGTISASSGNTITLSDVSGTWLTGMNVQGASTDTKDNPDPIEPSELSLTSSEPATTQGSVTTWGNAQWQVAEDSGFTTNLQSLTSALTSSGTQTGPTGFTLDYNKNYYVRTKYNSSNPAGVFSNWSVASLFKTEAAPLYADDLFSTYLYTGTDSTQTINNGIDLSGEGGLVWIKRRDYAYSNLLFDTERGVHKRIYSNNDLAESTNTATVTSFNSDGFSIGDNSFVNSGPTDPSGPGEHVSWTFRKAPGFFDVVTYTGDGAGNIGREISHNLGSAPGMIIIKNLGNTDSWFVFHKDARGDGGIRSPEQSFLILNGSNTASHTTEYWGNELPGVDSFKVGGATNHASNNYIAYLFADDDQRFGTNGDESIIKCGTYTGNASNDGPEIDLGFEPQFLIYKNITQASNWEMIDTMRGMPNGASNEYMKLLKPNTSGAEGTDFSTYPTSTGFKITNNGASNNGTNNQYVYMAIRRPHKPATVATDVFAIDNGSSSPTTPTWDSGFPVDMSFINHPNSGAMNNMITTRLLGTNLLYTNNTDTEVSSSSFTWDSNLGWGKDYNYNAYSYMFRRAPGFFDVVSWNATGQIETVPHGLGVVPEMMILKPRNWSNGSWGVYHNELQLDQGLLLESDAGTFWSTIFNQQTPTSTDFYVNYVPGDTVVYLFASQPGISKVGSFTGTGGNIDIDCGFDAGARFVLIKRTDSSGDWYFWDTVHGITSGNDPYSLVNTYDAQVTNTDYIDPLNAGFTVTSSAPAALNASGGTYLFLAIA